MIKTRKLTASHIGFAAALITAILLVFYAIVLFLGYLASTSSEEPISGKLFTLMEILILLMMPAMVTLMAALHARTPGELQIMSHLAVVFMAVSAGITCTVHLLIVLLSPHPAFNEQPWFSLIFAFTWPSVVYAADILAWDFFFPLSVLFAAATMNGSPLASWIRRLLIVSGVVAASGLIGAFLGNMQLRDIGVVGYVGVFLLATGLLAGLFYREIPGKA